MNHRTWIAAVGFGLTAMAPWVSPAAADEGCQSEAAIIIGVEWQQTLQDVRDCVEGLDTCEAGDWTAIAGDPSATGNLHNYVIWQNKDSILFQDRVVFSVTWSNQGDYSKFLQTLRAEVYTWDADQEGNGIPPGENAPNIFWFEDGLSQVVNPCNGFKVDGGANHHSVQPYVILDQWVDTSTVSVAESQGHQTSVNQWTEESTTNTRTVGVSFLDIGGSHEWSTTRTYGQGTSASTEWGSTVTITATEWTGRMQGNAQGPLEPIDNTVDWTRHKT